MVKVTDICPPKHNLPVYPRASARFNTTAALIRQSRANNHPPRDMKVPRAVAEANMESHFNERNSPIPKTLKRKRGPSQTGGELSNKINDRSSEMNTGSVIYSSEPDDDVRDSQSPETLSKIADMKEQRLRYMNYRMGPERFERDFVQKHDLDYRSVGVAFGIDPDTAEGDDETYVLIFRRMLQLQSARRHKIPHHNTLEDAVALLARAKKVLVITGAGISTSLGIPDFRSKGTGFYSKLRELGFTEPEEVFDIENFDYDPTTFYTLASDILPSFSRYTPTHAFIRLLQDHGKLLTNYTQNIDNLEGLAGISADRLLQCHGSFATATCRTCGHKVPGEAIFDDIRAKQVSYCKHCEQVIEQMKAQDAQVQKPAKNRRLKSFDDSSDGDASEEDDIPMPGVMKPDITFFGEDLPDTFFDRFHSNDKLSADFVLVIGTSMQVAPVAKMPDKIATSGRNSVPCVYIGREPCQHIEFDIQLIGDCDIVCWALADRLRWGLNHEMVPEGISVKIEEIREGDGSWWRVRRSDLVGDDNSDDQDEGDTPHAPRLIRAGSDMIVEDGSVDD